MTRTVSLPVETKVRELDGKLWLALHLASQGDTVYLGPQYALDSAVHALRPDLCFRNSAAASVAGARISRFVRSYGGTVAVHETEGAVYRNFGVYRSRLAPEIIEETDQFFSWGETVAEVVRDVAAGTRTRMRVTVVGNPTFDLLHREIRSYWEPEAERIRAQYGAFALVNTNFGYANPHSPRTVTQLTVDPVSIEMEKVLMRRLLSLIRAFAGRSPGTVIVLRPHPSERHDTYREAFADLPNVRVAHEGPVAPWLLAARVLLHNVCTTGIEGALLGRPVYAYCPTPYHVEEVSLANSVSEKVTTDEDAIARLAEAVQGADRTDVPARLDLLKPYIENVHGFAAQRIVDALRDAPVAHAVSAQVGGSAGVRDLTKRVLLQVGGEKGLDAVRRMRGHTGREQIDYVRQKFPGVTLEELRSMAARLSAAAPHVRGASIRKVPGMEYTFAIARES